MVTLSCQCGTPCGKRITVDIVAGDVVQVKLYYVDPADKVPKSIGMGVDAVQLYKFACNLVELLRGEEHHQNERRRYSDAGDNKATDKN